MLNNGLNDDVITGVRIKICGITNLQDAQDAVACGADALGFVFYQRSPRYIQPEEASDIIRQLPPFVSIVALFVNPSQREINQVLAGCPIDIIQLHGDESPEFCKSQMRRVIKAIPISTKEDMNRISKYGCAVLLDAKADEGIYGGTGKTFDWSLLTGVMHAFPLILAGGLDAENIAQALALRSWYAVDVSSGVELKKGIKDKGKMKSFCKQVHTF